MTHLSSHYRARLADRPAPRPVRINWWFIWAMLFCLVFWGVLIYGIVSAFGAAPDKSDPAFADWFRSLRNAEGISCCDQSDGHILADADWQQTRDGYRVRIAGQWRDVPPSKVLQRADNPTGSAVAFWRPGGVDVDCFVRAVEG